MRKTSDIKRNHRTVRRTVSLFLRIHPALYQKLAQEAETRMISMRQVVSEALEDRFGRPASAA